jgi:hypothetical protein
VKKIAKKPERGEQSWHLAVEMQNGIAETPVNKIL